MDEAGRTGTPAVRVATRLVVGAPVALVLVAAALVTSRAELAIAAVGPLLVVLAGAGQRSSAIPDIRTVVKPSRTVEGDTACWTIRVGPLPTTAEVELTLRTPAGVRLPPHTPTTIVVGAEAVTLDLPVHCVGWGAHHLGVVRVVVRSAGAVAVVDTSVDQLLTVLPAPERLREMVGATATRQATGVHPSAARGAGLEFADLRRFAGGDRPRAINWRATARSGDVWVNDRHPDRSADVIVVIDSTQTDEAGAQTLDSAVRAAAGMADVVLRRRDRVGYVGLGSRVRWITPDGGLRQWYRLAHALVEEQPGPAHPGLGLRLLPPGIVPADALVIAVSPLLDARIVTVLAGLRRRGSDVAVVEVDPLAGADVPSTATWQLARRLFELDRDRLRMRLAAYGLDVVRWSPGAPFGVAIAELMDARRRRHTARRSEPSGAPVGHSASRS